MNDFEATYEALVARYRTGSFRARHNQLVAPITAPRAEDLATLPAAGSPEFRELARLGEEAIRREEVGMVILAGGMATRFGYDRPKGLYPIYQDRSFLQWKIRWAAQHRPLLPVFVMTSFHTDAAVRAHLEEEACFGYPADRIYCFTQQRFRRLNPDGTAFASPSGVEDDATPGHGDFPHAIRACGALGEFLARGGKYLLFSNVDNLGATVEPAILGFHVRQGVELTVEVAAKAPGDKGGAPAWVGDRLQLVEGFCFPPGFDQDTIRVFNTANYVFSAEALDRDFDLPWYVVEKQVEGHPVIQFEHLAGDLSRELSSAYLVVDRDDRFIPVKSRDDVPAAQRLIAAKAARIEADRLSVGS